MEKGKEKLHINADKCSEIKVSRVSFITHIQTNENESNTLSDRQYGSSIIYLAYLLKMRGKQETNNLWI